jgi:hypothetical protein
MDVKGKKDEKGSCRGIQLYFICLFELYKGNNMDFF